MTLFRTILLALLLALPARLAWSQSVLLAPSPSASSPSSAQANAVASKQDLQNLLATLNDPDKLAALKKQIQALVAVQAAAAPVPANRGVGAVALDALSGAFGDFSVFIAEAGRGFGNPTRILRWVQLQGTDPAQRAIWLDILKDLVLSVGGGWLAAALADWSISQPRGKLAARRPGKWLKRLTLCGAALLMELLPILAFGLVSLVVVGWLAPSPDIRVALLAVLNAVIISIAGLAVARVLFSPFVPSLRLWPMSDATALYLYVWARRLVVLAVYGYVALQMADLFGLPHGGYVVASKLLGLALALLLVVLVLQNRQNVASFIRGKARQDGAAISLAARIKGRFGQVWHIVAILYIAGAYTVFAFGIEGGIDYLTRATLISLVVIVGFPPAEKWLRHAFDHMLGIEGGILAQHPVVAMRANRYLPVLRILLVYALRLIGILAVLAAWRVDVGSVMLGDTGRSVIGRLVRIVVVVVLSFTTWELANGAIFSYLDRKDAQGQMVVRSARIRTLLPLIRNVLLILVSLMGALITLSEIGVDIAPLLAGAGVVGLAIGFGAQTLVKDVIAGAFILFEDTINIGDSVDLNSGTEGTVEGLTVRSIRLRDASGGIHTLTFGSVVSIVNMSRDYSYWVLNLPIARDQDPDPVNAILKEIDAELRADPDYEADMLTPVELPGIDHFTDFAAILVARIRTRPTRQGRVGAEFNRRLRVRLEQAGIETPYPRQVIDIVTDRKGKAPLPTVAKEPPDEGKGKV